MKKDYCQTAIQLVDCSLVPIGDMIDALMAFLDNGEVRQALLDAKLIGEKTLTGNWANYITVLLDASMITPRVVMNALLASIDNSDIGDMLTHVGFINEDQMEFNYD